MSTRQEALGFIPAEQCSLQRRVLRDEALQAEFDREGFVVVPFLSASEVDELVAAYADAADSEAGINSPGAYNDEYAEFSIIHSRPDFRKVAFDAMTEVLVPHADELLTDYRPLIANFVNKPPGRGVVPAHQNFSVVDETRYQSVSVWVALVDCTTHNGAMAMLHGSHRSMRGRRGMWAYQSLSGIEQSLVDHHLVPLDVPAGHAVILDDALVHYSPPNQSDARRLAIQYVMIPNEADALWFQQVGGDDGHVEAAVLRVEEPFFFDFWHGDGDRAFAEQVDTITIPNPPLDEESFKWLVQLSNGEESSPATEAEPGQPRQPRWAAWRSAISSKLKKSTV